MNELGIFFKNVYYSEKKNALRTTPDIRFAKQNKIMKFKDWWGKEHVLPKNKNAFWRPSAFGLIIEKDKILLVKAKMHGLWELPGGGIEMNETMIEALHREVLEETGYKISVIQKKPLHIEDNYIHAPDHNWYFRAIPIIFLAKPRGDNKKAKPKHKNEVDDVKWFKLNKLPKPLNPLVKRTLRYYKK